MWRVLEEYPNPTKQGKDSYRTGMVDLWQLFILPDRANSQQLASHSEALSSGRFKHTC